MWYCVVCQNIWSFFFFVQDSCLRRCWKLTMSWLFISPLSIPTNTFEILDYRKTFKSRSNMDTHKCSYVHITWWRQKKLNINCKRRAQVQLTDLIRYMLPILVNENLKLHLNICLASDGAMQTLLYGV